MLWVLVTILSIQVLQGVLCGLSLMWLFQMIPRVLFFTRLVGRVTAARTLAILEAIGYGIWIVWRVLIRHNITWVSFIVYTLGVIVCCIVYFVDTESYVYIVEDDESEE